MAFSPPAASFASPTPPQTPPSGRDLVPLRGKIGVSDGCAIICNSEKLYCYVRLFYNYELGPRAADLADAPRAGRFHRMRDRRRLSAADVHRDRHPDDLHGTQGLRGLPMPPRTDARGSVGYGAGHLRCLQDAHQGDHHHPPFGQVPLQPRALYRHPRLGAGLRLSAGQQGAGGAGFQRGHLLYDGRLVDRRGRHSAGGVEFQQQVFAHRRHAQRCADDLLRAFHRPLDPYDHRADRHHAVLRGGSFSRATFRR